MAKEISKFVLKKIVKHNSPDHLMIQQYLEGNLSPDQSYELEKQALEDPFLWDALEGYTYTHKASHELSILQRQLHERIVNHQQNKKVFDWSWQRLSIAAAAAVMFIASGILFWMNGLNKSELLTKNGKQVEVILTNPDSLFTTSDENIRENTNADLSKINSPELLVKSKAPNRVQRASSPKSVDNTSVLSEEKIIALSAPQINLNEKERIDNEKLSRANATTTMNVRRQSKVSSQELRQGLSEVRINVTESKSKPQAGWEEYKKYIELNKRYPDTLNLSGTVKLHAYINQEGIVSNINIKEGIHPIYDQEAIRLLKEGPKWIPSADQIPDLIELFIEF